MKKSAGFLFLYIIVAIQCYSITVQPPTLSHGERAINVTFSTGIDAKDSRDWIGIFPKGACVDTLSCYVAYNLVADVLPNRLWQLSSNNIGVGLYDVRYVRKQSYFSTGEVAAISHFVIFNSKEHLLTTSHAVASPGDQIEVFWTAPPNHLGTDYIGMYDYGACNVSNNCALAVQYVPAIQVQGTYTFNLPQKDGEFIEFRYIRGGIVNAASSRIVYVRKNADITPMSGSSVRYDVLYDTDVKKKYEYKIDSAPKKAILTIVLQKNNTEQCKDDLMLMVKHNEVPTKHVNDFIESSSTQVTATFDIINDPSTLGKWYITVERSTAPNSNNLCAFSLHTIYFIRCPNDCSNRGTCNNGTCICSAGYSKDDCSKGLTPFNPPRKPVHPVLVLPGIGGSSLQFEQDQNDGKTNTFPSWLNVDNALSGTVMSSRNRAFVETMIATYNESTSMLQPLAETIKGKMTVWEENYGLRGISCLLTDRLKYWVEALRLKSKLDSAYYYEKMFDFMQDQLGYEAGKTLYGFGFDWRQTNRQPKRHLELRDRLKNIYEQNGGKQVDVIVHSMGGLFFKSFIAAYPEDAKKYVRSWTTIATPHHGASKAVHAFVGGYNFDNPLVDIHDAIALASETPAVYELFPDPYFKFSREPKMFINYTQGGVKSYLLQGDIDQVLTKVLKDYSVTDFTGHTYSKPFRPVIFERTMQNKKLWSELKIPDSIKYFNIYCDNIPTIFDVGYEQTVTDPSELIATTKTSFGFVPGDGTVPAESAFYDGYNAIHRVPISDADHSAIVKDERVFKWLRDFTLNACPLDGWWSSSALGNFFHIQQQLRQITFRAPLYRHMTTFSGYYEGGIVNGEMLGTGNKVVLNVSINCLSFDATVYDSTKNQILTFTASRIIGAECPPNAIRPCSIPHGVGVQRCYYGHWSDTCELSSCDASFCAKEDDSLYQYTQCVPCQNNDAMAHAPCPVNRPFLCSDGTCKANSAECMAKNSYTHPCGMTQVFCNNICVNTVAECLNITQEDVLTICPSENPYMCNDGVTCKEYGSECDNNIVSCSLQAKQDCVKEASAPQCHSDAPFLCSNNECKSSLKLCGTQALHMQDSHSFSLASKQWKFFHVNASDHLLLHIVGNVSVYIRRGELPSSFEHEHAALPTNHAEHLLSVCPAQENEIFVGILNHREVVTHVQINLKQRRAAAARVEACKAFTVSNITPQEMQHRGLIIGIVVASSIGLLLVVVVLGAVYAHTKYRQRKNYIEIQ